MNYVYLITNGCGDYKVGFTRNIEKRLAHYQAHNPRTELISFCKVQTKTKMQLETSLHTEIEKMGYAFIKTLFNSSTEWFTPSEELANQLESDGLKVFDSCKNRIVYYAQ